VGSTRNGGRLVREDSGRVGRMRRAKGTIHVFTFKDGILARAAHDLQIRLEPFEVTLDGDRVEGEFPLRGLAVMGPVEGGIVRPEYYDAGKRAEVERAMHADVLHTDKHPIARFAGTALRVSGGMNVEGQFELAGQIAPLAFQVRENAGVYRAEIEIQPSRWGIGQYKALLGASRVKDPVRIDIALTDT
jgi:hypothetical protein